MKLTNRFEITRPDKYNYCLVENKVRGKESKNAGEPYQTVIGYYGTLEGACIKAMHKSIDVKDMKTIISTIKKAEDTISKAIKKYGKEMLEVDSNGVV